MRILQTHSDWIEYEPIKKEIPQAEEVEKKVYKFENILVVFTSVESGDNEEVGRRAINEIKEFLGKIRLKKILIYPFVHLTNNPAKPKDALKILKFMETYAKELGIETYRAPFGWNKRITNAVKGHPLAEQSKFFAPTKTEEKISKVLKGEEKAKRMGKGPAIETEKLSENDHRVIGQKLDLYSFHEVGPGMVFLHHKGMIIKNLLIEFCRKELLKRGYQEVNTPIILDKILWEISGHWDHYKDNMFFTKVEDRDFAIKPMNCPGAILIYKTKSRSYRDLPLRIAEFGLVSRSELSGVLTGLFRVRTFTQDDAHIFVTPEQIEDEITQLIDLVDYFYKIFGFKYEVRLSTKPEDSMGPNEIWELSINSLKRALASKNIKYKIDEGGGVFYGPKIDFHIRDSLGRMWQCASIQLDFLMPERFKLSYIGKDGRSHVPIIIHRAIYGSIERFIGILVEHYQGKLPLWLVPIQVIILPLTDKNILYADKVKEELIKNEIRVAVDYEPSTIEYKIRNAQLQKIPYMVVVGDKEVKNRTIAVRTRNGKVKYNVKTKDFIRQILNEIEKRK